MSWLSGYTYQKKCTVVATTAGAQTNYQLELKVGESSGASGEAVDCESNCQDFPNDIRFTEEDGETKHDYWIESITGTTPNQLATVIIEVASIPASGAVDFYMYYGKSSDSGESSGDNTFEFFDDFEDVDPKWSSYAGNPILSPEGIEVLTAWGSAWKDGSDYHMFYSYKDASAKLQIGHATSADGKNWSKDSANNPILTKSGAGWDNGQVWDPAVWKEDSTWYMLYTGRNGAGNVEAIGLATASNPGGPWTKEATNPVLEGTVGEWDANSAENMQLMKVGSTYYLWYNTLLGAGANRKSGLATSTNLTTWTKDVNNPIFSASGGYFQPAPFKYGSYYYLLLMHYTSGTDFSEIQLYRDTNPTFYVADRELVRVVKSCPGTGWDSHDEDTPCILTTDIARNSFPSTELWTYYAGESGGVWKTGLLIETDIAAALASAYDFTGDWTVVGTPEIDDAHVHSGTTAAKVINNEYLSKDWGANKQWKIIGWFYNTNNALVGHWLSVLNNIGTRDAINLNKVVSANFLYRVNGGSDVDTGISGTIGWHKFEIRADGTNITLYIDNALVGTDSGHGSWTKIEFLGDIWAANTDPSWFDGLHISKYVSPGPTWGTWGYENKEIYDSEVGICVDIALGVQAAVINAEVGTGIDALIALIDVKIDSDVGTGIDTLTELLGNLEDADAGVGVDVVAAILATLTNCDTGAGADICSNILAELEDSDLGVGMDELADLLAAVQQSDLGSGIETEIRVIWIYLMLKLLQAKKLNISTSQGKKLDLKLSQEQK